MRFVGKKVVVRAIERSDLAQLAEFHNDPAVGEKIEFSWPISLAAQDKFFDRLDADPNTKRFAVETAEDGLIGYTGLWGIDWINRRATHGIVIGRHDLRRRGYATDTLMTVARAAFEEVGLNRLEANIYEFNAASLKLYIERCGWREEGRRREQLYRGGRFWDTIEVGLLRSDYLTHVQSVRYWG